VLYHKQCQFDKAEPYYQQALAIRERALESDHLDHLDVAESLRNLAWLYRDQSRHAEAREFFQRALTILERKPGPEHPDVAKLQDILAMLDRN